MKRVPVLAVLACALAMLPGCRRRAATPEESGARTPAAGGGPARVETRLPTARTVPLPPGVPTPRPRLPD